MNSSKIALLACLLFSVSVSAADRFAGCADLSGEYRDERGFTLQVEQNGCGQISFRERSPDRGPGGAEIVRTFAWVSYAPAAADEISDEQGVTVLRSQSWARSAGQPTAFRVLVLKIAESRVIAQARTEYSRDATTRDLKIVTTFATPRTATNTQTWIYQGPIRR